MEGSGTSESGCADREGSGEELTLDQVFEYWLGFGDGVVGMEKCFKLRNSVGKESVAGKAGMSQDWGTVSLIGTCNAGRGQCR